jgi:hypothetical protein
MKQVKPVLKQSQKQGRVKGVGNRESDLKQ